MPDPDLGFLPKVQARVSTQSKLNLGGRARETGKIAQEANSGETTARETAAKETIRGQDCRTGNPGTEGDTKAAARPSNKDDTGS